MEYRSGAAATARGAGVRLRIASPEPPRYGPAGPERWAREEEPFAGARALEDLPAFADDIAGTARVIARYAAVRLTLRAVLGISRGELLETERSIAGEYVTAIGDGPERDALRRVVREAATSPAGALCDALLDAGAAARSDGAAMGEYSLLHTAYHIARLGGRTGRGVRAALAISEAAAAGGGRRSVRMWRQRAHLVARYGLWPYAGPD